MKEYKSLGQLLKEEQSAFQYYSSLPDYVRSMIQQRSQNVCTMEQLQDYAENLLRGDG